MLRLLLFLAFALSPLLGCSLHQPQKVELQTAIPDQYLEQGGTDKIAVAPDRWWLSFDDPQLKLLMDELFAQSLELDQAFARLEQSRSILRTVDSARYPTLNIEAQGGRARQPQVIGDATSNNWQVTAAAGFELDLWGKLASRSDAAQKDLDVAVEDLKILYLSLSAQLADLYYLAVSQRAQIDLTDRTIASLEDSVALVESRYRQGLVPAVDVYQARQNLSAARANRHLSESSLAVAEHAIAVLIGRYPDRESAGELKIIPSTPAAFPAGLPSELISARPDLSSALRRVEAADARVAAAIADRFPRINLIGSYGHSSQEVTVGLIEGNFWNLLGQLTMPLIDGGRRRAEVDRSQAVLQEAVIAYQQRVLQAFREVEDALAKNRATELRIEQLTKTERSTEATLRLSRDRYLSGLTDFLPVLTAQRSHFDTQSRLLSARQQLLSERISLARALGGRWMNENIDQRLNSAKADHHE